MEIVFVFVIASIIFDLILNHTQLNCLIYEMIHQNQRSNVIARPVLNQAGERTFLSKFKK